MDSVTIEGTAIQAWSKGRSIRFFSVYRRGGARAGRRADISAEYFFASDRTRGRDAIRSSRVDVGDAAVETVATGSAFGLAFLFSGLLSADGCA